MLNSSMIAKMERKDSEENRRVFFAWLTFLTQNGVVPEKVSRRHN